MTDTYSSGGQQSAPPRDHHDEFETEPTLKPRSSDAPYYKRRTKVENNAMRWGKLNGVGQAARLLREVVGRSSPRDPWAWAVANGMDDMADRLGVSRATLFRYLAKLKELGYLTGEVRKSNYLKKGGEFPILTVPEHVVEAIENMQVLPPRNPVSIISGLSPSPSETSSEFLIPRPVPSAGAGFGVARNELPTKDSKREDCELTGVSGRLRRRKAPTRKALESRQRNQTVEESSEQAVPQPRPSRAKTPAGRLAHHFDQRWQALQTSDSYQSFPARPWGGNGVQGFYKWANEELIPAAGDEDTARSYIDIWCDMLEGGHRLCDRYHHAYRGLAYDLDNVRRMWERRPEALEAEIERICREQVERRANEARRIAANIARIAAERRAEAGGSGSPLSSDVSPFQL